MEAADVLVRAVLVPAAVTAVAAVVARALSRRSPSLRDGVVAAGVALAFAAALAAANVRPSLPLLPSDDAWAWVFWFAPAGALLGVLETRVRSPEGVKDLGRILVGCAAAWLVVSPVVPGTLSLREGLARAGIAGVVTATLWTALARTTRALAILPPLLAASVLLFEVGHSLALSQAAGALFVAVGATLVLSWTRGGAGLPAAAAPAVAITFVGILFGAMTYLDYGDTSLFPWHVAALLALAPALGALRQTGIAVTTSLSATVAAVFLAATLA